MIIIVDSDGFIGNLDPQDMHHSNTQKISTRLVKNGATLIYPATVIVETVTFLQGRLNSPELANQVIRLVNDGQLTIEPVDIEIIQKASLFMDFKKSKHNTLFDAVVAAIAQKYQADAIFSFDKFYKSKGFKLASEL
ncbi:type II toxin-antitoxin system VapC family toxin [Candidatus Daviesbacteria bacterium]|nr:type II toxin-antitoxin system VapC family toxin [Candidatus Daviesbacteria bacterium]